MTPHLCPKCQGERVVTDFSKTPATRDCPTCKGEGVLWGPGRRRVLKRTPEGQRYFDWEGTPKPGTIRYENHPTGMDTFTPTTGAT